MAIIIQNKKITIENELYDLVSRVITEKNIVKVKVLYCYGQSNNGSYDDIQSIEVPLEVWDEIVKMVGAVQAYKQESPEK